MAKFVRNTLKRLSSSSNVFRNLETSGYDTTDNAEHPVIRTGKYTMFQVQTRMWSHPRKPTIYRKLMISLKGVAELDWHTEDVIHEWPFETISGFFYAEDGCFFVFEVPKAGSNNPNEKENQVFRTYKQNDIVEDSIKQRIEDRLKQSNVASRTNSTASITQTAAAAVFNNSGVGSSTTSTTTNTNSGSVSTSPTTTTQQQKTQTISHSNSFSQSNPFATSTETQSSQPINTQFGNLISFD